MYSKKMYQKIAPKTAVKGNKIIEKTYKIL